MFYAGIDAHAQYLRVVVLDKEGNVVAEGTVSAQEQDAITRFLRRFRPLHVVVETCPFWPWLRDQLEARDVVFHLAHSRELRAIAQHAQKNDAVDAHLLARMLLTGLIPPAHAHASSELDQLRLVRHHAWLIRHRTMFANRIHAQLHQSGVQLPRECLLQRKGQEELRGYAPRLSAEQRRVIRTHLVLIKGLNQMLGGLRKQIRRSAADSRNAILLRSVPGIGPYWALLLSAELAPIERFRSADQLVSYAGLAPITHATGGQVRHGPLPKAANRWVRGAFVAAVMSHLRHAPNSRLSQYYARTKARLGWKKARVATARKLARMTFSMLRLQRHWQDENLAGRDSKRALQAATALSSD
jgi:transposase